eukprot:scaffold1900_cov389-Prasinococcus_capsulatus_cf.AAC.15
MKVLVRDRVSRAMHTASEALAPRGKAYEDEVRFLKEATAGVRLMTWGSLVLHRRDCPQGGAGWEIVRSCGAECIDQRVRAVAQEFRVRRRPCRRVCAIMLSIAHGEGTVAVRGHWARRLAKERADQGLYVLTVGTGGR